MCKLVTVLALLAAAENSTTNANATHVSEEILVTDVHPHLLPSCG